MRRASSFIVVCLLLLGLASSPAFAVSESGAGVILDSPLLFTAAVGSGARSWFLMAYQTTHATHAYIYAYEITQPLGVANYDEAVVEASAISLAKDPLTGLWNLTLSADLPTVGAVDLRLVADQGFDTNAVTSTGWWNYRLESPSRGLSGWGNIYGSVDGDTIVGSDSIVWGTGVTGVFVTPPLGSAISF
jgi:hypothetical protein